MRFSQYSLDEAIQVLHYLAAEDPLVSLKEVPEFDAAKVKALLKEISVFLEDRAQEERKREESMLQEGLSFEARQIMAALSPREERVLYRAFKLN